MNANEFIRRLINDLNIDGYDKNVILFSAVCNTFPDNSWKVALTDGSGQFIAGFYTINKDSSYSALFKMDDWNLFHCPEFKAP